MLSRTRPLVLSILLGIGIPVIMYAQPAVELEPPVRKDQSVQRRTPPAPAPVETKPLVETAQPGAAGENQKPQVVTSLSEPDGEKLEISASPDKYEPDSRDKPLSVEIGAPWIARTIHEGDEDWFSVSVSDAGLLVLETNGSLDTVMELYDADSSLMLVSDDDGGTILNARIEYPTEADKTYLVKIRGFEGETGSYSFGVEFQVDPNEPNNTQEEAILIQLGSPLKSSFRSNSDEDWYQVDIPEGGGLLTVYTEGKSDTDLILYDEEGNTLAEYDDYGPGVNALVPEGTIYIQVTEAAGQEGPYPSPYTLHTQVDPNEPNNTQEEAIPIQLGSPLKSSFRTDSDVDWYRVDIPEGGGFLTVYTEGKQDTELSLYDEDGNVLATDDDSGSDMNARVSTLAEGGTVYIQVTEVDGQEGPYTLHTLLREPGPRDIYEPDDSQETAKEIDHGTDQERTFTLSEDVDWVFFTVVETGRYEIRTISEGHDLDTTIELYDEEAEFIADDDDSGEGFDACLQAELEPGTYFILIRCLDEDPLENANYTLRISRLEEEEEVEEGL